VDRRNHLRLWLAPVTFDGQRVWIGQISRDIDVYLTLKSPTIATHMIDPDVDETRNYLLQDLLQTQGLARLGFAQGVGPAPFDQPRHNLTGDAFFTDGLRAVFFMSEEPVGYDKVDILDWERPAPRHANGKN
jgi:hypothetical protein